MCVRTRSATPATKDPDTKQRRRRDAATVAGYAGPGFHNWPSGHIPQDTAAKPLLRIRPPAKKTFGEAFGAATGVSDPRLQKIRIRNNYAGKLTSRRGLATVFDGPNPDRFPELSHCAPLGLGRRGSSGGCPLWTRGPPHRWHLFQAHPQGEC